MFVGRRPAGREIPAADRGRLARLGRDEPLDEVECGLRDLLPAVVDGQRVAAVGHLLDLGDARVALLPLVGGVGVARAGGLGENFSGDLFIAFASGNRGLPPNEIRDDTALSVPVRMLSNRWITPLFQAVVEATEEAILNALVAARTTSGRGATAYALKPERLVETLTSLGWRP